MPPITPSISTAGHDQAELTGVIKARLGQVGVPASLCGAIATDIVETAGFDTPEAIRDMEEGQLQRAGVKEGHLKRVCRALFNDAEQPWAPVTPELAAAQPPAAAPPEAVTVTVTKDAEFTCPLPAKEPTPEELTDIGLALRAHLRKQGDESWGDVCFKRFNQPWEDISDEEKHALKNKSLATDLLRAWAKPNLPMWAASIIRAPLAQDDALGALLVLCRQVYSRTEVSDRELKNRVRNPLPESKASNVARRLALWDTDVSAGELRGFVFDEGDKIAALEDIVANLPRFKHVVIANKQSQGFNAMSLRKAIGKEADLAHADATSVYTFSRL